MSRSTPGVGLITYTSLYPNSEMPQHGLFVEQRLRRIVATGRVHSTVIASLPWFPLRSARFGQYARMARVPRRELRGDIEVLHPRYPMIPKFGMNIQAQLLTLATRTVVDRVRTARGSAVLDAHYFYPDGVAAVAIGQRLSMPVTITARGSDINAIAEYAKPRAMILDAAKRCAAVVTVSEALRQRLIQLGVAPSRITVLRNGVDLNFFSPGSYTDERDRLGLSGHVVLSVGRLVRGKGHHLAIEAMQRLSGSTLLIAGEGPESAALRALSRRLGVDARVRFLGSIPPQQLCACYRSADVLVLASEAEGMPNVVLEAMACGASVVATNVGGVPEVLHESVGRLISERSGDAIADAIETIQKRRIDRHEVRAWAEQFDWCDTIERSVTLYERVAG